MVLKILTRHSPSYASLIDYIIRESKAKDGKPHVFTHNLRGNEGQAGWAHQYMQNEAYRQRHRADQLYLTHEIVAFSNLDNGKITRDMLNDITKKYIELRGKNGVYVSAAHFDKEHVHIHFAVSALEYRTGKGMRLSKEKLNALKIDLQEYHKLKYPELSNSIVEHGKGHGYVTDKEWQYKNRTSRKLLKEEIGSKVKACFEKATTQKEFLDYLRQEGLHHYERGNQPQGIITANNLKIRFSNLHISKEQLQQLPINHTEEEKILKEIQNMRKEKNNKQPDIMKAVEPLEHEAHNHPGAEKFNGQREIPVKANIIKRASELLDFYNQIDKETEVPKEHQELAKEAKEYTSPEAFAEHFLFHGSSEGPFYGTFRRNGYDGITVWATDDPRIAQNYIPETGIRAFFHVPDTYMLNQRIAPHDYDPQIEKLVGVEFSDVTYSSENKIRNNVKSWCTEIPKTHQDVVDALKKLGYKRREYGAYEIKYHKGEIVPADFRQESTLHIFSGKEKLNLYDLRGGGDLVHPDYWKHDEFRACEYAGYDGVIIDDFAQSKSMGNYGHTSIGLFESGYHKLTEYRIPAKNFDDFEDSKSKTTDEFTELYNELRDKNLALDEINSMRDGRNERAKNDRDEIVLDNEDFER